MKAMELQEAEAAYTGALARVKAGDHSAAAELNGAKKRLSKAKKRSAIASVPGTCTDGVAAMAGALRRARLGRIADTGVFRLVLHDASLFCDASSQVTVPGGCADVQAAYGKLLSLQDSPLVILTPDTGVLRHLAAALSCRDDRVIEIGCSFGACSRAIFRAAQPPHSFLGLDNSTECVEACRRLDRPHGTAHVRYERLDVLAQREGVCALLRAEQPSLVVADVGGIRALADVTELLETVLSALGRPGTPAAADPGAATRRPVLVVVKSQKLATETLKFWQLQQLQSQQQPQVLPCPKGWWSSLRSTLRDEDEALLAIKLLDRNTGSGGGMTGAQCRAVERRFAPGAQSQVICQYHNYAKAGCTVGANSGKTVATAETAQGKSVCPYNHEHCHFCLAKGHRALECEVLRSSQRHLRQQRQQQQGEQEQQEQQEKTNGGCKSAVALGDRITRALVAPGQPKPRIRPKEIAESIAFVKRIRQACGGSSRGRGHLPDEDGRASAPEFIDVAGGHGCVALSLLAFGITDSVTIVDPFRPKTFDHAFAALKEAQLIPAASRVRYDERPLAEALPDLLAVKDGAIPAVVACHACAHLTLQIVEMAAAARAPLIGVMPCCHSAKILGSKFKSAADALGMPLGVFADVALFGALGARGYSTQMLLVNCCSETSNRLVVGKFLQHHDEQHDGCTDDTQTPSLWPIASSYGKLENTGIVAAQEHNLHKAYMRVHNPKPAGTGRKARKRERKRFQQQQSRQPQQKQPDDQHLIDDLAPQKEQPQPEHK